MPIRSSFRLGHPLIEYAALCITPQVYLDHFFSAMRLFSEYQYCTFILHWTCICQFPASVLGAVFPSISVLVPCFVHVPWYILRDRHLTKLTGACEAQRVLWTAGHQYSECTFGHTADVPQVGSILCARMAASLFCVITTPHVDGKKSTIESVPFWRVMRFAIWAILFSFCSPVRHSFDDIDAPFLQYMLAVEHLASNSEVLSCELKRIFLRICLLICVVLRVKHSLPCFRWHWTEYKPGSLPSEY